MGIFEQIFGSEIGVPARFVVAFVVIIALIGLAVWLIRYFGAATLTRVGGSRGRQPRLAVLETAAVDARRRLVLIRRDNFEHLLLIGGPTDVVVEPNIVRAVGPAAVTPAAPTPREPIIRASGRAAVLDSPEVEAESPLVPAPATAPEPIEPRVEPPAPAPEPRPAARVDPQYSEMAERLEAALRRPMDTAPMPRVEPIPEPRVEARPAPAAAAPKAEARPTRAAAPKMEARPAPAAAAPKMEARPAPAPAPVRPEVRPEPALAAQPLPTPAVRAPAQARPAASTASQPAMPKAAQPATPRPAAAQRPAPAAPPPPAAKPAPKRDVFDNLEEEMANLLGRVDRNKPN